MSENRNRFRDLAGPLYADAERRTRVEAGKRAILAGTRLAELRTQRGLTQAQLARRLDMSQQRVARIEHGEDTEMATVRCYVEALGGRLELHAVFADLDTPIAAA